MKHKKILSFLLVVLLLCGSLSSSFECIAANAERVDSFAEAIEELNAEEAEEEKTLEESAGSRVIVKAAKKPETYGNSGQLGQYYCHLFLQRVGSAYC